MATPLTREQQIKHIWFKPDHTLALFFATSHYDKVIDELGEQAIHDVENAR